MEEIKEISFRHKKNQAKKKLLNAHQSYSYECPITLCQPLKFTDDSIEMYFYIIEQVNRNFHLGLLSNMPLSDIPDFKIYHAQHPGDWEYNEKHFEIWKMLAEKER
jgi:hypothetical protein